MSTTALRRILTSVTALPRYLARYLAEEIATDHAFFNDAGASADAWQGLLDWFSRYLAAH